MPVRVCELLQQNHAAFLLGSTAPDVQTVSGQRREDTHFFDLPIQPGTQPPWDCMLQTYPWLSQAAHLPPAQAAFIAGYLSHLLADWLWILEIFAPIFGPAAGWQSFRRRLYLHNVLRAHLDRQIKGQLPTEMGAELGHANPDQWLPFVADLHLRRWRDFLAQQLRPGAAAQTVEVFATRQGISTDEYNCLLESEERLEQEIFSRLSHQAVQKYRDRLLDENVQILKDYLRI